MTETKNRKPLKHKKTRHAEYYDQMYVGDKLYAESKEDKIFTNLMSYIKSDENIMLAYRNIKRNQGGHTPGVDGKTIKDIENLPQEEFITKIRNKLSWYNPKPVKRVEIPKPNGKVRPLGIPCIWDRVVQQCILQVMEPICEAKFYKRSNGFRPNRSAEHAIAQCCRMMQIHNLSFVVDIDIKGFFDNVNHTKLRKQIWALGIRDKKLLCIITEILKAPIVLPDKSRITPDKGTPQGGILSPLLSNICLNELDWWVASQWEKFPSKHKYAGGHMSRALRTTKLKEMYIVRYADDFKIFCRTREDAEKIYHAVKSWLNDRLKLQISEEKSKIVNLKKSFSEFLGFKLKVIPKGKRHVVQSHISDKAISNIESKLKNQIKAIQWAKDSKVEAMEVNQYNAMVIGVHNYYRYATHIAGDMRNLRRHIEATFTSRFKRRKMLSKKGTLNDGYIKAQYGKSRQLRFLNDKAICPIGFIKTKNALHLNNSICKYTPEGREAIHKNLGIDMKILHRLMQSKIMNNSIEYHDNRISLYAAQHGKCAITGKVLEYEDIHCHHKIPKHIRCDDSYKNLIIINKEVHRLIHATGKETIIKYMEFIKPTKEMITKINKLRKMAELEEIA